MEKKDSDEIDLYDLSVKAFRLFKANIRLVSGLVLAGLIVSIFIYNSIPKIFVGRMMVLSTLLPGPYSIKFTESLDNRVVESDWAGLAKQLNLSAAQAAEITKITAEMFKEKKDSVFIVVAEVTDKQVLPP